MTRSKTVDMVYIAVGTVLIAVCSWISIPFVVPFTLQTFAVFFVLSLLGGMKGTISIVIYILLGAIGVPVFSGITGGIGKLAGLTGGYIISSAICKYEACKFLYINSNFLLAIFFAKAAKRHFLISSR